MSLDLRDNPEPVAPSESDSRLAQDASRRLGRFVKKNKPLRLAVASRSQEVVAIPPAAARLLVKLLSDMGAGHAVALTPIKAELTTQQAADLMGVSRPFLVKEIEKGRLRCRKVGKHRRIRYSDLMAYKRKVEAASEKALDELIAQSQELGLY
jgi:excisionase family DNA binding protein